MDVIVFHAELCTVIERLPDVHVTLSQKTAMCGFHTGHSEGLMPSSSGGWPGQRVGSIRLHPQSMASAHTLDFILA